MRIGPFFDLFLIIWFVLVFLLITGKVAQCKQEWYMSSRPWYKIYIFVDLGCSSKPLSSCHICGPFSLPLGQPVLPLVQTFASEPFELNAILNWTVFLYFADMDLQPKEGLELSWKIEWSQFKKTWYFSTCQIQTPTPPTRAIVFRYRIHACIPKLV